MNLTFKIFGFRIRLTNERSTDRAYNALLAELGDKAKCGAVADRLAVYRRALNAGEAKIEDFRAAVLRAAQWV
jgi:predicted 3-demethylubiquinone-9 3-methyltransferase (glyoxalase superfamily)